MNLVKKESWFWLNRPKNEFIFKSLSANVLRLMKHQMTQRPFWKNIKTGEPWNLGSRVPFATQWWCCTQTIFFCCAIDLWTFKQFFWKALKRKGNIPTRLFKYLQMSSVYCTFVTLFWAKQCIFTLMCTVWCMHWHELVSQYFVWLHSTQS